MTKLGIVLFSRQPSTALSRTQLAGSNATADTESKGGSMWLWIKRLMLAGLIVLAVSQVFRPARTNPPIDPKREISSNLSVDTHVAATLTRACNDCHSNR